MRNLMLVMVLAVLGLAACGMGAGNEPVLIPFEDIETSDHFCCQAPKDGVVSCRWDWEGEVGGYEFSTPVLKKGENVSNWRAGRGEKCLDGCAYGKCCPVGGCNTVILPDAVGEDQGFDGTEETGDNDPLPDAVDDEQEDDNPAPDVPVMDPVTPDVPVVDPVTPDESADLGEPDTTLDNPPVEDTSVDNPPDQCLTPVPLHCESTPEATYYMDPRNFHCTHWAGESEPVCKPVLWYGNGCSRPYRQDGKYWANSTCFVIRKEKCPDILAVVSEDNKDKVIETCFSAAGSFWCFVTDGNGYAVVRDPTGYEKEFQVVEMEESELKRIDTDVCPTGS